MKIRIAIFIFFISVNIIISISTAVIMRGCGTKGEVYPDAEVIAVNANNQDYENESAADLHTTEPTISEFAPESEIKTEPDETEPDEPSEPEPAAESKPSEALPEPTETSPPATRPATEPPTVTTVTPATEPPPIPTVYVEAPRTDFIQYMFNNALKIPGGEDIVEPPPKGRSAELQYKIVPLSDRIPEPFEYFGNIIMLGDSVTMGFDVFKSRIRFNGDAVLRDMTVISSGSYGVYEAEREMSENTVHPSIGGYQYYPEDIIAASDAENVLICLGLNDTWQSIERYIAYYSSLIQRILYKSPDKKIAVMSVTPATENQTRLNNDKISEMNNALIEFAAENGYMFIDHGAALRDSDNFLYSVLSSDDYCHLTLDAYNRLVEYMLYHPIR